MSNPRKCSTCNNPESQIGVQSDAFLYVDAAAVKELLQKWPRVSHVCKATGNKWAYVHFRNPTDASASFNARCHETDRGDPVSVFATSKDGKPVTYSQTPPPRPPPPPTPLQASKFE